LGSLTREEIEKLPKQFDTIPYSTFFKLWYAVQKSLPYDKKETFLQKSVAPLEENSTKPGSKQLKSF
jgi:hypothetical protein